MAKITNVTIKFRPSLKLNIGVKKPQNAVNSTLFIRISTNLPASQELPLQHEMLPSARQSPTLPNR
jgi:hypothetical protein